MPSGESWIEELKNGNGSNRLPWQFNAKELDETGLYYYGARYYNPRAGVWMSPDPAFDGAFGSPMGMARYTYAHNNPVRFTDPLGLSAKTGSWTAEESSNPGSYVHDEFASSGVSLSGPGTSNAHATPSESNFAGLTGELHPIAPPPNWRDDGNIQHQGVAMITGDAPEMRGPQLRRQAYTDVAKTSAVIAANVAITVVPFLGEERALALATGDTVDLFRAVGVREFESVMNSGKFLPGANSLEGRQFAHTLEEALKYADTDLTKVAVLKATVRREAIPAFDFSRSIDPHIFNNGVITVQPGTQSDIFHQMLVGIEHAF